jgi:hypothetical protein
MAAKRTRRFKAIASRDLILVMPDGFEKPIHVAIGAPYKPAQSEGMEQYAACLVLACDEPSLATESFGADELEALIAGVQFIESFLLALVDKSGGHLKMPDGAPFDPRGSILLRETRRLQAKR